MRSILFAAALLAATPALAQTPLPLNIGGRVAPAAGEAYDFGWPGVYFEGRFTGPSVEVAVDTGAEHLAISVDGVRKAELTKSGETRLKLDHLSPGEHVVRLDKLTESQAGSSRFEGFFVGPRGKPLAPPSRPRRIEFIGDSHTVGYGVRSTSHDCTESQVHDLTDTSLAFGPTLAARLDADYRIVAFSGRGVVRNYNGVAAGEPLPVLFPRLIPGQAEPRVAANDPWKPDIVVIGLGTNDFSTPLHAGEAWADEAALRKDYRDSYVGFIQGLKASRPGARIFLIAGDTFADDVAQVAGRGGATAVRITNMDRGACHWHPSVADQRMMADRLEAAIRGAP
ncbi:MULTISPECIES: SGNH/GDSL hydrolase family protein [unclassified Caulobacter]|uniref:SGNH/GDSL hydrolase family protein n=1 Tax=unclassified Caulobacter TaxID=2648921 RepID=UPI0006F64A03|nr:MULTISPECIES: SGNH/GDSL hydrolase family protein [unclassified Caulobacter]KQV56712.1 lipase [Caulobacter sp. Root342]KQV72349.1 lipase [Caulobacter sp. Root343]